jgi:hypothetical protein
MDTPVDWLNTKKLTRNVRYKIQSWIIIDAMLTTDSENKEDRWFNPPLEYFKDWVKTFIVENNTEDFVWYDMAVGQRGTKIAYMIRRCLFSEVPLDDILGMIVAAEIHMLELMEDEKIATHSNHGLFQMAGLLALGRSLPFMVRSDSAIKYSTKLIRKMLKLHFSSDGLHKEHSPDYHIFMTNFVALLLKSGLMGNARGFKTLAKKTIEASYWMCQPDGNIVPFGDTKPIPIELRAAYEIPIVDGKYSSPEGLKFFHNGGLVVHSSRKDGIPSGFLAFAASFHSRQHKHADDLTLQLFHDGEGILTDAGTFTYQYDLEERIFIESTRAHNTVEIDGKNYSRYLKDAFGSAINFAVEVGNCIVIDSEISRKRLVPADIPNNNIKMDVAIDVDIVQRRMLVYHPDRFLLIFDHLKSDKNHDYTQWLHLYPNQHIREEKGKIIISKGQKKRIAAIIHPILPEQSKYSMFYGNNKPRLQGWISENGHALKETNSMGISARGKDVVIATLIDFSIHGTKKPHLNIGTGGKYIRFVITQSEGKSEFIYRKKADGITLKYIENGDESEVEVNLE